MKSGYAGPPPGPALHPWGSLGVVRGRAMLGPSRVGSATPCLLLGGSALALGGPWPPASPRLARRELQAEVTGRARLLWPALALGRVVGLQPGLCPGAPSGLASCGILLAGRSLLQGLGTLSCGQGCVAGAFPGTPPAFPRLRGRIWAVQGQTAPFRLLRGG